MENNCDLNNVDKKYQKGKCERFLGVTLKPFYYIKEKSGKHSYFLNYMLVKSRNGR